MNLRRLGFIVPLAVSLLSAATWTETSQADFKDGDADAGIYASWRGNGTVEFAPRFDLNNDGFLDLFIMASSQVHICWGSDSGYRTANRTAYPDRLPVDCIGADLDCDGYAEFISSDATDGAMAIYAGTPAGPSPSQVTLLPGPGEFGAACLAADFNKDGWLDLTVGGYGIGFETYVYWGSATGYSVGNRTALPGDQPCHNPEAADFNRDGWLDYLQSNDVNPQHVYWGSAAGLTPGNRTALSCPGRDRHHGKSTADLNADGWLDLVFTSAAETSYVFWGSASGFLTWTRLWSNPSEGGSAIADMNNDGWLDIVFASELPKIYWGTDSGFSEAASRQVGQVSRYSGIFIADLDGDSTLDIFLNDRDGSSPIYWGPDWLSQSTIETDEDHFCMYDEPGNTYDREYLEAYRSSVFDAGAPTTWGTIAWDDTSPGGSAVELAVRTGDTASPDPTWTGWVTLANGADIPDSLDSRYIQYRATLRYLTPAVLPMLYEVRIDYGGQLPRDVGAVEVLSPVGTVSQGSIQVPGALIRNFGTEDAVFPVTLTIGTVYSSTVQETLPAGTSDTVVFAPWTAGPAGVMAVTCYTALAGDEYRSNDTARAVVTVASSATVDVGTETILGPTGTVDSGSVHTPAAIVRNYGTDECVFQVIMRIGAFYGVAVVDTLAGGLADTVRFSPWTADELGVHDVVCSTLLTGDENPANDTVRATVEVVRHFSTDVAASAILAPSGVLDSGVVVVPRAIVKNLGDQRTGFPVTMTIGDSFSETLTRTLDPDQSDTVSFPAWTAWPWGTLPVTCFTSLAVDENRANDTAIGSVIVNRSEFHDVGVASILSPEVNVISGDTVVPRALVRNYGSRVERYFDVRFRIGAVYDRVVTVASLPPNSAIDVSAPAWVATSGNHTVSCSTMLAVDADRSNDRRILSIRVTRQSLLFIEPDGRVDRIDVGGAAFFDFYAEYRGEEGTYVELTPVAAPGRWSAQLYDSTHSRPLGDTAGGRLALGFLEPEARRSFAVHLEAPADLSGDTLLLGDTMGFVIRGYTTEEPPVSDSATLRLVLVPELHIHNFPNPLSNRSGTTFLVGLPDDGTISLTIYNRAGERIRRVREDEEVTAGLEQIPWDATNDHDERVAPGTYQYVFEYTRDGRTEIIIKKLVVAGD